MLSSDSSSVADPPISLSAPAWHRGRDPPLSLVSPPSRSIVYLDNGLTVSPELPFVDKHVEETRKIPLTFLSSLSSIYTERDSKEQSLLYIDFTSNYIHTIKEDCSLLSLSVIVLLSELGWVSGIRLVYYIIRRMARCLRYVPLDQEFG